MPGMNTMQLFEKPLDCCEEDSLADLKPATRGAGACWGSVQGQRCCQTPLLHLPSTLIALVVHSDPALSYGPTKAGRCTPVLYSPPAALKLLVTYTPQRRCSLITWLWWPGNLHFWVPWESNNQTVLGRLPCPGHYTD